MEPGEGEPAARGAAVRPTRRGALGGALGLALGAPFLTVPSLNPARAASAPEPIRLRRGVNLWPWFSLTREFPAPRTDYGWPPFQEQRPVPMPADLARLAGSGLDFVRLPIDPGPFLAFSGERRAALLAQLDAAVAAVLHAKLNLVLNVQANVSTHHYNPQNLYGDAANLLFRPYRDLIAELARRLSRHDRGRVVLEPVNEPQQACGSTAWDAVQAALLTAARVAAPDLTLVATGACGSMIRGLTALDPAPLRALRPLIYSFHFYEPYLFTHQGAPWMQEPIYRALNAVPWPSRAGRLDTTLAAARAQMRADPGRSLAEKDAAYRLTEAKLAEYFAAEPDRGFVDRQLVAVRDWATRNGIPEREILMGEFGALRSDSRYVAAGAADRARYIRDVRQSAEAFGFPWAFWNLFDGMGLIDDDTRVADAELLSALGLKATSP
ncbi:glycoside hydrolase family 5 protein [Methylobacterium planeticum]|uniref:Glycoside hydrolase family 5 protein n=1 Tax=Methylobacterium planeticum TaxID=2615211 RepID=A0A6N6MMT3_9HYPH|nr:cellulase family glycosylhydrolase [Methylobacterium planeticum]KAB1072572.1 glycoside hydrolase family 5 protein [Methylobacterium planeticum]